MNAIEALAAARAAYKRNNGAPQPEGAQVSQAYSDGTLYTSHTECLYVIAYLLSEVNRYERERVIGPGVTIRKAANP
jgi:hypothetical protein